MLTKRTPKVDFSWNLFHLYHILQLKKTSSSKALAEVWL